MVHVMSEVIWYYDEAEGGGVQKVAGLGSYVKAGDFHDMEADRDAQRLRADTAEAEVTRLEDEFDTLENTNTTTKLKLAAAEQRISDMGSTLAGALKLLRGVHTGDLFGPDDWETVNAFLISAAALNPNPEAESHE